MQKISNDEAVSNRQILQRDNYDTMPTQDGEAIPSLI